MSVEHVIPEGILRHVDTVRFPDPRFYPREADAGLWVELPGNPRGQFKQIPPRLANAWSILCERHNVQGLSSLDAVPVRLFKTIEEMANGFIEGAGYKDGIYFFNGHDIERFLLKILCGYTAKGYFRPKGTTKRTVPLEWVEILFGRREFGPEQGLYVPRGMGVPTEWDGRLVGGLDSVAFNRAITVVPVGPEDEIGGVFVRLNAHWFLLRMCPDFNPFWLAPFNLDFQYRPQEVHFRGLANERTLLFFWDQEAGRSSLCYRVSTELVVVYTPDRYGR